MAKVFITITGMNYYHGSKFIKPGMRVALVKEPDNAYDSEAIKVYVEGLGKIGYVANSPHTVLGESMSAGRLYDKFGFSAIAKVKYVSSLGVICKVSKKSLQGYKKEDSKHMLLGEIGEQRESDCELFGEADKEDNLPFI